MIIAFVSDSGSIIQVICKCNMYYTILIDDLKFIFLN